MTLNTKEITNMCKSLSYKFNSANHREDLVQEGLVRCYELLATDPKVHPAKLHREAKRAMHDYLNLSLLPVDVPAHNISRRLSHDINDTEKGDMGAVGHAWLKLVMTSNNIPYDEDFSASDEDTEGNYERKEALDRLTSVALKTLSIPAYEALKMRYFEGKTQDEVATIMGTNKMRLSRIENRALKALKKELV